MIKKKHFTFILSLVLALIGFCSCSDSASSEDYYGTFDSIFSALKANYSGSLTLPNNTRKDVSVSIADDVDGSVTSTDVKVNEFPLDGIFSKVYPNDYDGVSVTSVSAYVSPVDSIGFPTLNCMNFKTNSDNTADVTFSYTKGGVSHSGWTKISTYGMYFSTTGLLDITFTISDLVIDNQDMADYVPIVYELECSKKQ
nr:hypothetical protein [Prevotella sp.]